MNYSSPALSSHQAFQVAGPLPHHAHPDSTDQGDTAVLHKPSDRNLCDLSIASLFNVESARTVSTTSLKTSQITVTRLSDMLAPACLPRFPSKKPISRQSKSRTPPQ